jgi:ABC-type nitrate/sulfonate/bicarbonate transport system permease component
MMATITAYFALHWEYFIGNGTGLVIGLVFGLYFGWIRWGGRIVCPTCQVLNDPLLGQRR